MQQDTRSVSIKLPLEHRRRAATWNPHVGPFCCRVNSNLLGSTSRQAFLHFLPTNFPLRRTSHSCICFCIFGKLSFEEACLRHNGSFGKAASERRGLFTLTTHSALFDQAMGANNPQHFKRKRSVLRVAPPVQKAVWEDFLIREHAHRPDIINIMYYKL